MRQWGHILAGLLKIQSLACFVNLALVDLLEEGEASRFLTCRVLLLNGNLVIHELHFRNTQVFQPSVINDLSCSGLIVSIQIYVADFDHLSLWICLKNFTQSVGKDRHEVLVNHLVEALICDDASELKLDIIVKSEVDLTDGT